MSGITQERVTLRADAGRELADALAACELALEDARRGRRVVIVTRTAFDACQAHDAIVRRLTADDQPTPGRPLRVSRANGLWSISTGPWEGGRIDVRMNAGALRGMSADTLLIDRTVPRTVYQAARPIVAGAMAPVVGTW